MVYMLLIHNDESQAGSSTPEQNAAMMEDYNVFTQSIINSGNFKSGDALMPTATATTVRVRGNDVIKTDGPFAETKEQLGGFYMVDCADLDEALEIASRIPGARTGSIEVRPVMVFN